MIIGKVIGTVICTRKEEHLIGSKFLIVKPMESFSKQEHIVAVDNVGAGVSDIVLLATGSAARVSLSDAKSPVDALIIGIVDDPSKIVIEGID